MGGSGARGDEMARLAATLFQQLFMHMLLMVFASVIMTSRIRLNDARFSCIKSERIKAYAKEKLCAFKDPPALPLTSVFSPGVFGISGFLSLRVVSISGGDSGLFETAGASCRFGFTGETLCPSSFILSALLLVFVGMLGFRALSFSLK